MSGKVDWKDKYFELRSKYLNAIDVAFRLGAQEGQRNAEMENLQQQVAQAEEQAAMAAQGGMMPGEELPPEEMMPGEELPPEEGGQEPDLDSSINELESFVKAEKNVNIANLMKSIHKSIPKNDNKKEPKSKKAEKIGSMIKKWDNEDATVEDTNNGEIIGQA